MSYREKIIAEIIEWELAMFMATPNRGGPASCQERPATFKIMRQMAHSVHNDEFLDSYLQDLRNAEQEGRNFMIEKYARMDDLIPPLSTSPLIDEIVNAECSFMEEAARTNPHIALGHSGGKFPVYLRSELETLSERSLELYAKEIAEARLQKRNPVLERYNWLENRLSEKDSD